MRVGLTLSGDRLSEDGAGFARELGIGDVVVPLTDFGRNAAPDRYPGGGFGPVGDDCIDARLGQMKAPFATTARDARASAGPLAAAG